LESANADLSAELSSLGQGSPGFKPELLSVEVRMRALANLSTAVSLLLLRFDVYMPCRMAAAKPPSRPVIVTEVWQLFVSECSAVDAAFVAFLTAFGAVDTAFGA